MRRDARRDRNGARAAPARGAQALTASHRDESLDVFRGLTVAAMILVNNPGDWTAVFPPLLHEYWFGWTFADLVFPWFVFVMGVTMPMAFSRRRSRGDSSAQIYVRIGRRVILLIALGLVLNAAAAWPDISPWRFPGVLQRIALAYLAASIVVLHSGVGGWAVAAAALMFGHWALLAWGGSLTPEHNLAGVVDTAVFGNHLLRTPIDPEGLLGTLTAAATALTGALAGEIARRAGSSRRVGSLAWAGAFAAVAGAAWSSVLPIGKPLWTGSFVLLSSGLAMLTLAAIALALDAKHARVWVQPFRWLGENPLAIYFLSEIVGHALDKTPLKSLIFWSVIEPAIPLRTEWASLAFAVLYVVLWAAFAALLHRRNIRIQV